MGNQRFLLQSIAHSVGRDIAMRSSANVSSFTFAAAVVMACCWSRTTEAARDGNLVSLTEYSGPFTCANEFTGDENFAKGSYKTEYIVNNPNGVPLQVFANFVPSDGVRGDFGP